MTDSNGSGASSGQRTPASTKHNIVFVFTDQERYFSEWPAGMSLPGRERLQRDGVSFKHHYGPAVMCTSSRAVIMTGLQTPDNGMFENADMPYVPNLDPAIPTIGHMLRKAGYYTAYKGKWHLNADFDVPNPEHLLTKEMEEYGFADYAWPGDVVGHTLGGYTYDSIIGGTAVSWLRDKGRPMADENKPWALFVSLVNPHDIMYFNTDEPGKPVQDTGTLMMHAAPAPKNAVYRKTWDVKLPDSLTQPMDEPGRPRAHDEFLKSWGYTLGLVPPEEARWHRFWDFYLNSIRNVDRQLELLLDELDALSLTENTIVVFTSDHGEMGGSHGLRGKGPFAYQENMHLPLHIMHPDIDGGQESKALTGHIDFVPTILSLAGATPEQQSEFAGRDLPGRDFSDALGLPRTAELHSVRDGVLFTYSGVATNDSEVVRIVSEAKAAHRDPKQAVKESGYQVDFKKRGTLRAMFDGRYKFNRYCGPTERNAPKTVDDLYRNNDLELFDLENDPTEMVNLAAKRGENEDLVMACSAKLEGLIKDEIGVDDGREMPELGNIKWTLSRIDL